MTIDACNAVARTFCSVLEKMAFMFADAVGKEDLPFPEGEILHTRVVFSGEQNGEFDVLLPAEVGPTLAANMLGLEPDDEQAAQRMVDAVNELANVACGNILSDLVGVIPVFSLSAPVTERVGASEWDVQLQCDDSVAILLEEGPILLRWSMGESQS